MREGATRRDLSERESDLEISQFLRTFLAAITRSVGRGGGGGGG